MSSSQSCRLTTPKSTYTVDYPEAVEFRNKQAAIFWPAEEIHVEKDKQDILVNMTEAERHGVITTLKLFTKYELIIGEEFWLEKVMKAFPRPEIQSMAAMFGAMELSVHAPFYAKLNEELNLATDEFYNSYTEDPVLADRIKYLDTLLGEDDLVKAVAAFTFIEGAVLYSSFAYLKHFQTAGKNKLLNVVSGINFSARDEALHAEAAAWLVRQLVRETDYDTDVLHDYITDVADKVLEHEQKIIEKIFEMGDIDGITRAQLEAFVRSRINICVRNLGFNNYYVVNHNPVADTFYKSINGYAMNDFFNSVGNQYERSWNEERFTF
ncbi:MAG: ribonucleotide-diphosphate reductase subunit beta [Chromatiales bacterium]|nr:ribonucleotide-diphosphate reductase subunit beta [Chromatiales bacterium]